MNRYAQVDITSGSPQRLLRLIETDEVIEGADIVDVTDRHDICASAWYDASIGQFVDAPPAPAPQPPTLDEVLAARRAAYAAESDPIKNEAEYDALVSGVEPDYTAWMAAVAAIKERYPLPE